MAVDMIACHFYTFWRFLLIYWNAASGRPFMDTQFSRCTHAGLLARVTKLHPRAIHAGLETSRKYFRSSPHVLPHCHAGRFLAVSSPLPLNVVLRCLIFLIFCHFTILFKEIFTYGCISKRAFHYFCFDIILLSEMTTAVPSIFRWYNAPFLPKCLHWLLYFCDAARRKLHRRYEFVAAPPR